MSDLFGQERQIVKRPLAYAAAPGSGPEGKTCKTCAHRVRKQGNTKFYNKCDLVRWSRSDATDIRVSSPACWRYEECE